MARVLLTHDLACQDARYLRAVAHGHTLVAKSMLLFENVPYVLPEPIDWLFAYSRQAVKAACVGEALGIAFRQNLGLRLGAIGPGTAAAWQSAGYRVDFTGEGPPEAVAKAFENIAFQQRVAFLQAAESRQSIQSLLAGSLKVESIVTYRATVAQTLHAGPFDIYLLTSPRNAQIALSREVMRPALLVFCIGETTAAAVDALGFTVSGIAARAQVESLLEMI